MKRSSNLRNSAIVVLAMLICFAIAVQPSTSIVNAQAPLTIVPNPANVSVAPGGSAVVTFQITNNSITGAVDRQVTVSASSVPTGFSIPPVSVFVAVGATQSVNLTVTSTSASQAPGTLGAINIQAVSAAASNQSSVQANTQLTITVTGATFTPTPSLTPTNAPATVIPTRGPVCADGFEPDNDSGSAKVIDVNTTQERTICPSGDEDWIVFGGVSGKVYTIDVTRMDSGIDLSLELFDDQGRSIAFNDDFFNRDPLNPGDIRPRLQSIVIPYDGRYYIRVRDAAGRGGVNFFYVIALVAESYGPTPTNVAEICIDRFEPDGLPEQARLITSNELQESRRLCPSGDADWLTFFAKSGKRYIFFTDTRRYKGVNTVNGETQAGADTVVVITDRDGISLIDFNDDIPGGNTLDSQIEFTPQVDGFYFIQIKNVGDIGNQFIRYDFTLLLCLPGQTDCGRTSVPGQPVNPVTPNPQNPSPTPDSEFNIDPTRTPTSTPTLTVVP